MRAEREVSSHLETHKCFVTPASRKNRWGLELSPAPEGGREEERTPPSPGRGHN